MPTLPSVPARPGAAKIQNDLRILTERLARINDNLARKISSRNEYDKTIQETEGAYAKVRRYPCHHTSPHGRRSLSVPEIGWANSSLRKPIREMCPEPQLMVSCTHLWLYLLYGRSWRARKRCCMCSSGRAST